MEASVDVLNSAPDQFSARDVHGGDGLEQYMVATLNEFSRGGVLSVDGLASR